MRDRNLRSIHFSRHHVSVRHFKFWRVESDRNSLCHSDSCQAHRNAPPKFFDGAWSFETRRFWSAETIFGFSFTVWNSGIVSVRFDLLDNFRFMFPYTFQRMNSSLVMLRLCWASILPMQLSRRHFEFLHTVIRIWSTRLIKMHSHFINIDSAFCRNNLQQTVISMFVTFSTAYTKDSRCLSPRTECEQPNFQVGFIADEIMTQLDDFRAGLKLFLDSSMNHVRRS